METQPLLKTSVNSEGQEVQTSRIGNLMFGNIVLFVHSFAAKMHSPILQQYVYHKMSVNVLGNVSKSDSRGVCFTNTSDPSYLLQEKAQQMSSQLQMELTLLRGGLSVFSISMLGTYADFISRRLLLALPVMGHFLMYTTTTLVIYFELNLNFFFLANGLDGLLGGPYSILLGCYAYSADNTPPTGSRTMAIAFVEFFSSMASSAASTACGYFIQDIGFFYPMLTSTIICLLNLILVSFFLQDKRVIPREPCCCITPMTVFKRVFGFYFVDGSKTKRLGFSLIMIVFIFNIISGVSSSGVDTLFKLNLPFCWSPEQIGYFSTASSLASQILGVPLTRLFQVCLIDEIIAIIGSLVMAAGDELQAFASTDWMMYAVAGVKVPGGTLTPVTRAIMSRMAPASKQGSLFASIAVIENTCSLVGTPIFSNIYQVTVTSWRGCVYIVMGGTHIFGALFLVIYTLVYVNKSKQSSPRTSDEHDANTFRDICEDNEYNINNRFSSNSVYTDNCLPSATD